MVLPALDPAWMLLDHVVATKWLSSSKSSQAKWHLFNKFFRVLRAEWHQPFLGCCFWFWQNCESRTTPRCFPNLKAEKKHPSLISILSPSPAFIQISPDIWHIQIQPPTNHQPTTNQPPTNHQPTTNQPRLSRPGTGLPWGAARLDPPAAAPRCFGALGGDWHPARRRCRGDRPPGMIVELVN